MCAVPCRAVVQVLGYEDPETLASGGNLAATHNDLGQHAEAERLQAQILAVSRRVRTNVA